MNNKLIEAQIEYIKFLENCSSKCASFLHTHSWKWTNKEIDKGYELRNKISALQNNSADAWISGIRYALDLAQCELRAMYKRLDIKGSNVLDIVDKALEALPRPTN